MAISDAEYTAWLNNNNSAYRCVLIEATVKSGGSEVVRYMSNRGYVTSDTDTPANTTYKAIIKGGVKLTETLSLDSNPTMSFGDIEIENIRGNRDSWLNDIWENRQIAVYFGDVRWARSDFRLVFAGIMDGLVSRTKSSLNILVRDTLQRLNTPVYNTKFTVPPNKDKLYPLCYGECHNVTPVQINSNSPAEYMINAVDVMDIIEVRDGGVPVSFNKTVSGSKYLGTFSLKVPAVSDVTVDCFGAETTNTIKNVIVSLVTNFGTTGSSLSIGNIDSTNFTSFDSLYPYPVGLYLTEKENLLDVCQRVAGSVGAQVAMSRTGLLRLLQINLPASGTPTSIEKKHIQEGSFSIDSFTDVKAAIKIGYAKNWTVQNNIQSAIPDNHRTLFATEWFSYTASDGTVGADYKFATDDDQIDTLLIDPSNANSEANRRLTLLKQKRTIYKMTCFASMLNLELGQAVTLTYDRFGLNGGVSGQVVGLEPDWIEGKVIVKVIV